MSGKEADKIFPKGEARALADAVATYMYVVDYETDEILLAGDYYANHLGVPASQMEGRKCWEFVCGNGRCEFCPRYAEGAEAAIAEQDEGVVRGYGGDALGAFSGASGEGAAEAYNPTLGIWGRMTSVGFTRADGRRAHIITVIDISEEKLLREELSHLAFYDSRMELPNSRSFEKDVADRAGGKFSIVAFEYISLHYANEVYGRPLVNVLLNGVVRWIGALGLQNCEVYRLDGAVFCLLMDNADKESAYAVAERLKERFLQPWDVCAGEEQAEVSCRAAVCVADGGLFLSGAEDVSVAVASALRMAKNTDRIVVYDRELGDALKRETALEVSLKNCVRDGMRGFDVYYQPIADPRRARWVGLEALCRWDSPEFGRVPPLVFIQMAERIGIGRKIGNWVLDTAIQTCSSQGLYNAEDFFLDVNVSLSQISDETFINKVLLSLQTHGFPAKCLYLALTEARASMAGAQSHTNIERLASLDMGIALDDFGSGYSDFNNLYNLPVRSLKMGRLFAENIAEDSHRKFLAKAFADIAHEAGMSFVAEGVEDAVQMRALLTSGADYLQGYLFAKPLTASGLAEAARGGKFRNEDEAIAEIMKEG